MVSQNIFVPSVTEREGNIERTYDLYSRLMKDNIILVQGVIEDYMANLIVSQLLFLNSTGAESIKMYINSPGGSVTAGLAIYDTMQLINSRVETYGMGCCASMGAFLLSAGHKGYRYVLPNAEVMIHQVAAGTQGKATDMAISLENVLKLKERLTRLLALHTGKSYEEVYADCERDKWMDARETKEYGLVDEILEGDWLYKSTNVKSQMLEGHSLMSGDSHLKTQIELMNQETERQKKKLKEKNEKNKEQNND